LSPFGVYVVNIDDVRDGVRFRDAVTRPMTKTFWEGHKKHTFEVRCRCFLPKKINNVILTGGSVSFAYKTLFMVMRNVPWCTQTGEIAGYAAARCIDKRSARRSWSGTGRTSDGTRQVLRVGTTASSPAEAPARCAR
jgi:hypothetical protein